MQYFLCAPFLCATIVNREVKNMKGLTSISLCLHFYYLWFWKMFPHPLQSKEGMFWKKPVKNVVKYWRTFEERKWPNSSGDRDRSSRPFFYWFRKISKDLNHFRFLTQFQMWTKTYEALKHFKRLANVWSLPKLCDESGLSKNIWKYSN